MSTVEPRDAPTLRDLEEAARRLRGRVHQTPILGSRSLGHGAGVELFFKCENLQRGGAFKIRGALNKLLSAAPAELQRGVVTWSSGNHAQGVALAARELGVRATVVMPEDAVAAKVAAVRAYGAEVRFAGRTSADRLAEGLRLAESLGLYPVPPYDDPAIVCGQATVGMEIAEQAPGARTVLVPVGGGGLLAGVALALRHRLPQARVVGVEALGADKAWRSLAAGRRVELQAARTIADGLRPLALGELNWAVIRAHVGEVIRVSDLAIADAVLALAERAKLVVEPSGAASVAAALAEGHRLEGPVVALLSGGNLDLTALRSGLRASATSPPAP